MDENINPVETGTPEAPIQEAQAPVQEGEVNEAPEVSNEEKKSPEVDPSQHHGEVDPSFNCPDCVGDGLLANGNICPKCAGTGKV